MLKHRFLTETWDSYLMYTGLHKMPPALPQLCVKSTAASILCFSPYFLFMYLKTTELGSETFFTTVLSLQFPKKKQFFLMVNIKKILSLLVCWDFLRIFSSKNSFQDCLLSFFPESWKQFVDLQEADYKKNVRKALSVILEFLLGKKKSESVSVLARTNFACSCVKLWWNTL